MPIAVLGGCLWVETSRGSAGMRIVSYFGAISPGFRVAQTLD